MITGDAIVRKTDSPLVTHAFILAAAAILRALELFWSSIFGSKAKTKSPVVPRGSLCRPVKSHSTTTPQIWQRCGRASTKLE